MQKHVCCITQKNQYLFIFDIVNLYSSISIKLLNAALNFALVYCHIPQCKREIITQACTKQGCNEEKFPDSSLFGVTMGSFDGADGLCFYSP